MKKDTPVGNEELALHVRCILMKVSTGSRQENIDIEQVIAIIWLEHPQLDTETLWCSLQKEKNNQKRALEAL